MTISRTLLQATAALCLCHSLSCPGRNGRRPEPSVPAGPAQGRTNRSYVFSCTADDPDGDSVAVRFDWGDGTSSDWSSRCPPGTVIAGSHAWTDTGGYPIRAKARDSQDRESPWSDAHLLQIGENRPPGKPLRPTGPGEVVTASSSSYATSAWDPDLDSVAIRFDWGDGDSLTWSVYAAPGETIVMTHVWSEPGEYDLAVQSRDELAARSGWSTGLRIRVRLNNPPMVPVVPRGDSFVLVGEPCSLWTWSSDPDRDSLSYQLDWGERPDDTTAWSELVQSGNSVVMVRYWSTPGVRRVRARVRDTHGRVSDWSPAARVEALDAEFPSRVSTTITVTRYPARLAASRDGRLVYVGGWDSTVVIDTRTNQVVTRAAIPAGGGICLAPDDSMLFVANSNTVSFVRARDLRLLDTLRVNDILAGLAVLPGGDFLYVAGWGRGRVYVIRVADRGVVAEVTVDYLPTAVASLHSGEYVYVANRAAGLNSTVSVIRTSDNTLVAAVPIGQYPQGLGVLPRDDYVYVAYDGEQGGPYGNLKRIRVADNTVTNTLTIGRGSEGMACHPDGRFLYVACANDNSLSILRTGDQALIRTVAVGQSPRDALCLPDGSRVYVANASDGTVSVLER